MFTVYPHRPFGALVFAVAMAVNTPASAETITLRSSDGSINLTGAFVGYGDDSYIIDTVHGELRVAPELVSCKGDACPITQTHGADIVIGGSDTIAQTLAPLLLEGYADQSDARISVAPIADSNAVLARLTSDHGLRGIIDTAFISPTNTRDGFHKLLSQQIDVAMSARAPQPADATIDLAGQTQEIPIALDGIAVVTHPRNPVTSMTTQQLRQVFAGEITNWADVGGADMQINVIEHPNGSAERPLFMRLIAEGSSIAPNDRATIALTQAEAAQLVSQDIAAISYVSFAHQGDTKAMTLINACGLALTPDAFSTLTSEYPLHQPIYMYTRAGNISEGAQSLIDYTRSGAADAFIGEAGFVGFGIARRSQDSDTLRAQNLISSETSAYRARIAADMLEQMAGTDRLSTTFRFREGSSRLDPRGEADQERLIAYLADQPEGTEIILVGFTDSLGTFGDNLRLAGRRARQAETRLRSAGTGRLDHIEVKSLGFGEIAPTACNTDAEGRQFNRRVEVWIAPPAS